MRSNESIPFATKLGFHRLGKRSGEGMHDQRFITLRMS